MCVAGDGDFLMYPQELATAAQYGARLVVLIVNNGMYGTIRMHQERRFPGRVSATALDAPDFVQLAQSFGAHAERVETTAAFAPAFERALARAPRRLRIGDRPQVTHGGEVSGRSHCPGAYARTRTDRAHSRPVFR